MNDQKIQESQHEANVGKRRRFLQKAGIVTPVVLTFTSPSVFGGNALCMSQQLSGANSNPSLSCNIGAYNPHLLALTLPDNFPNAGGLSKDTVFNSVFGGSVDATFGTILNDEPPYGPRSDEAIYITALVNAQTPDYILDVTQVKCLYTSPGVYTPDGYSNAIEFLLSTFP